MSGVPPEVTVKSGPNYIAYYKHLVLDLFSDTGECFVSLLEEDSAETANSSPYFTEAAGKGLSQFKRERLSTILNESAIRLNVEVNEMFDNVLATFKIGSNLRKKEELASCSNASQNEEILYSRKRKAYSRSSSSPRQGKDDLCAEALEKYTIHLQEKLGSMEKDLEDFLSTIMSKCRPMTDSEKHQLGKKIRRLPERAHDRVADILRLRDFSSTVPEIVNVDLERQDNVTLWRLHYYVELVLKASKL